MFLKEFNYSLELQKMRRKYNNSLLYYGLLGEERVAYQLNKLYSQIMCLYNIRLFVGDCRAQYDFIAISSGIIFVIEVKNLYGNLIINDDDSVEREIYKDGTIINVGMDNPFIQMDYQVELMIRLLESKNISIRVESILVMANDKMLIKNKSKRRSVIKYDELVIYLKNKIVNFKLGKFEKKVAEEIYKCSKIYDYSILNVIKDNIKNQYIPNFDNYNDLNIYLKILKVRQNYAVNHNMPICNVFSNKEAERIVYAHPQTKEEFINIKGFKEKRYNMFGEEIIKIFKNE